MQILHRFKQRMANALVNAIALYSDLADKVFARCYLKYSGRMQLRQKLKFLFLVDFERFHEHSWLDAQGIYRNDVAASRDPASLSAVITMEYHRIEKGLALPNRREGASQDVVQRLISAISKQRNEGLPSFEGAIGLRTLTKYFEETPLSALNEETKALLPLYTLLNASYAKAGMLSEHGGYREIEASEMLRHSGASQIDFLKGRHSIRDFRQTPVDRSTINEITRIAMSAPSVCNRQAWHLYALTKRSIIRDVLTLQNGNRGFTERIPLLFIVASDLRHFVSAEERNQAWIDGGLFSMMLSLALYAKGLGSCMLNWCATYDNDNSLRRVLKIPDYEAVVMMMAAGYLPDRVNVTSSPRKDTNSVLTVFD
jgi:nitroreductase